MNLTNTKRLEKFWQEKLLPVFEKMKAHEKNLLDCGKTGSSWDEPANDVPDLCELSPSIIENELQTRFNADKLYELADITPELMALAEEIRPTNEQIDKLDEFVYVMY